MKKELLAYPIRFLLLSFLLGTGGRTVDKVFKYDLSWGTNNLSIHAPAVVGSKLDDLAHVPRDQYKVRVVVVCQVINRNWLHTQAPHLFFMPKQLFYISICLWSLLRSQAFLCGHIVIFLTLGDSCCPQMVCTVIHKDSTICTGAIVGLS